MPELGSKYQCQDCDTPFYDLGRPDAVCPKCGWNPKGEETPKAKGKGAGKTSS